MDGRAPTYDELLELTRRQARQIDELRSEVQRLKAELEQARQGGQAAGRPLLQGAAQGPSQTTGTQARAPAQPSAGTAARAGRSHRRGPAAGGLSRVSRPAGRGIDDDPRPVPDRPARAPARHHPLPGPGRPLPGLLPPGPGPPPRADLRRPRGRRRPVRPPPARARRRPEAPPGRLLPQVLVGPADPHRAGRRLGGAGPQRPPPAAAGPAQRRRPGRGRPPQRGPARR